MSSVVLIKFNLKEYKFNLLDAFAKELVLNSLKENYAVFFNDDYCRFFFKEGVDNTILISDSFLYRQADGILDVTNIIEEDEGVFKKKFIQRYEFLKKIIKIMFKYKIEDVNLFLSEGGESDLGEYISVETYQDNMIEKLYEVFVQQTSKTGFTFPNIKIHVKNMIKD